jgi:hypothetical protein
MTEAFPASYPVVTGKYSPLLKRPGREPDHLFPSHAETKGNIMYFHTPNVLRVTNSRRMRWIGHVALMEERRGA